MSSNQNPPAEQVIQVLRLLTSLSPAALLDAARGLSVPRNLAAVIREVLRDQPWYLDVASVNEEVDAVGMAPSLWRHILATAEVEANWSYVKAPNDRALTIGRRLGDSGDEEHFFLRDQPDVRHPPSRPAVLEAGGLVKPGSFSLWWQASPRAIWTVTGTGADRAWRLREVIRKLQDDLRDRGHICHLDDPDALLSVTLRVLRHYAAPRVKRPEDPPRCLRDVEIYALSARLLLPLLVPTTMGPNRGALGSLYLYRCNPWFHALHPQLQALLLTMVPAGGALPADDVARLARQLLATGLDDYPGSEPVITSLLAALQTTKGTTDEDARDVMDRWLQKLPGALTHRMDVELDRVTVPGVAGLESESGRLLRGVVGHVFLAWAPCDYTTAPVIAV